MTTPNTTTEGQGARSANEGVLFLTDGVWGRVEKHENSLDLVFHFDSNKRNLREMKAVLYRTAARLEERISGAWVLAVGSLDVLDRRVILGMIVFEAGNVDDAVNMKALVIVIAGVLDAMYLTEVKS